ncbi:MAG TPA: class I adenylate-forming enzyme family protein [Marmoricola sp.]|nr:class I adenylate-forming enzyme family protein [Marmoricola sp.]
MTSPDNTTVDPRVAGRAIVERLTAPGAPFELTEAEVLGSRLPVFAHAPAALHEVVADSVAYGERTYIATSDRAITFAEHARAVSSLARALREEYDVRPGDRVAIAAANSPEWIEVFWATVSIGAVAVGFNAWWSARELAYGMEHSRPAVVVVDGKRKALLGEQAVPMLTVEEDVPRLAAAYPDAPLPSADVDPDAPAVMLYTSGTSGRPKGALHSHRNVASVVMFHRLNDAILNAFGDPTAPEDRVYLCVMPLFHIGSLHNLAVPRLANGSKIALHQGAFDVDRVLRLVEQERVTNWGAVPTMANRLLEHGDLSRYDTSSLTAFALASAPSSVAFKQRLRQELPFAASLVDSYGLTETCTAVAVASPLDMVESPGTLGSPIVPVQMEVRDLHGHALPPGEEGEVCVRSVYNMLGYWEDDQATARTIRVDRWLHTGDIGVLDEQGRVRLSSRRSDLIIRGGENVYPAEVEGVLSEHPEIAECVVLGIAHEDLGQEVAAVVVPREGTSLAGLEDRLAQYAADQLSHYKVPTHWRVCTSPLPRNATGKVLRTAVQA